MITEKTTCRLCDSPVKPVFALTPTPIANDYKLEPDSKADAPHHRYPLELCECTVCGHVQQRYLISGLFEDYKYTTPATVARYLDPVAKLLRERFPNAKTVLEIGSNNGTNLKVLRSNGFDAEGVDPAAVGDGYKAYFSHEFARKSDTLRRYDYDLIIANNVFAHIDDLHDVFKGVELLLAEDGALIMEVQYLPDLIKAGSFDMIYHEHMSYHTIEPLKRFVKKFGMVVTNVDHLPLHGGSIRLTIKHSGDETNVSDLLSFMAYPELIDWDSFTDKVNEIKVNLQDKLKGRRVVAFGAAAKATTLIHHCDIAENIKLCVDDTPEKQYRYIPGTDIKIWPTHCIVDGDPILMLAWNYEKEIREMYPNSELIHPFFNDYFCVYMHSKQILK